VTEELFTCHHEPGLVVANDQPSVHSFVPVDWSVRQLAGVEVVRVTILEVEVTLHACLPLGMNAVPTAPTITGTSNIPDDPPAAN
jgi:hypothetical protein